MSITIVDIAQKLGVSYTSVSRALTGKKGVGPETRKRILAEAEKLGYQPNALARGLVSKSTSTVGLLIPDITNPFFPEVARGVEEACRQAGYNLFLCNSNWDRDQERRCLEALQKNRVDGLIINPSSAANVGFIEKMRIPVVFLNTKIDDRKTSYVGIDNALGAGMAVDHLLACGYKRIAFIGGTDQSYSNVQRQAGYVGALRLHGLAVEEGLILNGSFDTDSGYQLARRLLESPNPPDAIVAGNDIIALGVLQYTQEKRLAVPQDFGLVGFDDIYAAGLPQVQLTTIALPKRQLGRQAFSMLLEKMGTPDTPSAQYVIQPQLVVRNTTRTPSTAS
jgi:LacI family transcriptional regulator